jgi:serine/threonine protein kinase
MSTRTGARPTARLTTARGATVEVGNEPIGSGTMKDVYMAADQQSVVAVFRDPLTPAGIERIRAIIDVHRPRILEGPGGADLAQLYRWPYDTVNYEGRLGLVVPVFEPNFFFEHGSANGDMLGIRGKEKQGKWFASAHHRTAFLDPRERGHWIDYLRVALRITRAVRRMHAAGLAHSDLSYKNVLVDPLNGSACIIDIDGLVVPGKFPPDVVGTPDFIAPEVVASSHLAPSDPKRLLPSIATDRHALAVLIYMYLLGRHPLQGRKVHDPDDAANDDHLAMGPRALWVEHPSDRSNSINLAHVRKTALPWADTAKLPFTICGPLLGELFRRAFVDGLHDPSRRPTAEEWERALVLTADMLLPCDKADCEAGMYVFDNSRHPACPLCGTLYAHVAPILNLYSSRGDGNFRPDGHRVTVFDGLSLYGWHASRFVFPNERLEPADRARLAYVQWHSGAWHLVNTGLSEMLDVARGRMVKIGDSVLLAEGAQILLSRQAGGRLIQVQISNG